MGGVGIKCAKIFIFAILGLACLGMVMSGVFESEMRYRKWKLNRATYVLYALTSPTFTIIFGVLTLHHIITYMQYDEEMNTDLMELFYTAIGFWMFFILCLHEAIHWEGSYFEYNHLILLTFNSLMAIALLIVSTYSIWMCNTEDNFRKSKMQLT